MEMVREKLTKTYEALKEQFGYSNPMAAPKIEKVVVNVGTGKKARFDRHWNDTVRDRLANITGQMPASRAARLSNAGFKIRQGDTIGQTVTLRGTRMISFLDKVIHIALPRTKDFRGIKRTAVDEMGNITFGIKEHTIFPEAADEELKNIFGMSVTIVTTAKTQEEAMAFLTHVGIPFTKEKKDK